MNPLHLPRLQSLHHENPTKRISLIRLAWPDIEKALARGHTLKLIHSRLTEDEFKISYSLLSLYVRRLQGKPAAKRHHQAAVAQPSVAAPATDRQQAAKEPGTLAEERVPNGQESVGATPPPTRPAVPVPPQKSYFMTPDELNARAAELERKRAAGEYHSFFIERVPDIYKFVYGDKGKPGAESAHEIAVQSDPPRESIETNREQGSLPRASPDPAVRPQRRGLMTPSELNALTANDPDNEGCWFREHVPDINELFR